MISINIRSKWRVDSKEIIKKICEIPYFEKIKESVEYILNLIIMI